MIVTLNHPRSSGLALSGRELYRGECKTLRFAAPWHLFQEAAWRTGPVTLPSLRVLLPSEFVNNPIFRLVSIE